MEAGYDYLLLRSRLQQQFIRTSAIFLVIIGAILLTAGIAYFVYAQKARSDLSELNYTVAVPQVSDESVPATSSPAVVPEGAAAPLNPVAVTQGDLGFTLPLVPSPQDVGGSLGELAQVRAASTNPLNPPPSSSSPPPSSQDPGVEGVEEVSQSTQPPLVEDALPQISPSAIASQQLYPGEALKSVYWGNPLEYEPDSYIESSLIQGFKPLDPSKVAALGTLPAPTRIIIPSIGVDSDVTGLKILDLGDTRAYETPKHVVGHIPQSANPGEKGSTWFFGHLESPIAGEGNVFYNLPKIPDLLRKGEDVYAIVGNGVTSYLYRIIETRVVHQDDMKLYDTGGPTIHLVACVPRWVYDHRLIVTGELVGIR